MDQYPKKTKINRNAQISSISAQFFQLSRHISGKSANFCSLRDDL